MKLSEAVKRLSEAGVPSPKHDARELFSFFGGFDRAELLTFDAESSDQVLCDAVARRCRREPLQYIIGKVFFYNEEYKVNENCLIPRSDTEILVEYACKMIPEGEMFLDLCTGSGCIGISTLKNTLNTKAVLSDISEGALALAKENAESAGVGKRASFRLCDVKKEVIDGSFFAVLSNPPYVTEAAYDSLEKEIYYEPKIAFVEAGDGAGFYRAITSSYKTRIKQNGFIAYEIGYDQGEILKKIASDEDLDCEIIKDYSGNDRVAVLRRSH